MFAREKVMDQQSGLYATKGEFCRIFQRDMNRLHLLSFLLTADRVIAEQCFVGGLHSAQNGNRVFKKWAESWARRAIIRNAIRMVRPQKAADATRSTADLGTGKPLTWYGEFAGIVGLPAFERFAFVMSVLERYSDQECSLLLGCSRREVAAARTRALEQLGKSADLQHTLVSLGSNQKARTDNSESAPQWTAAASLAASA